MKKYYMLSIAIVLLIVSCAKEDFNISLEQQNNEENEVGNDFSLKSLWRAPSTKYQLESFWVQVYTNYPTFKNPSGVANEYFHLNTGDHMIFWCNSERTELRSTKEFNIGSATRRWQKARLKVLSGSNVTIMQLHGGAPTGKPFVRVYVKDGVLRAAYKTDGTGNATSHVTFGRIDNEWAWVEISVQNYQTSINTSLGDFSFNALYWSGSGNYFKLGSYPQSGTARVACRVLEGSEL